jgi:Spy/CpxP family protein refolding chaperone
MRFWKQGWAMVAGLVIVAMVSQVAMAQREEGRRGRGGRDGGPGGGMMGQMSAGRLLRAKEVQDALKLTDEQKEKITKINDDAREAMQEGGREKFAEIMKDTSEKINEVLDDGQEKRLTGILIQVNPVAALMDPAVAKELNITDDQKTKMRDAAMGSREEYGKLGDLSREERGKKIEEIQAEVSKKVMAELTSDQQAQLEKMKGEKVEIDMSQLRGRGGFGDRQRSEGGERPRRDRNPESKSEEKSN